MPAARKDEDKPPVPPVQPELEDCCHSGCEPCIFELYEDAMDRYRLELQAWEARNKHRKKKTGGPAAR
jgi:hypothetical protein